MNTNPIRCLVVDDEPQAHEVLKAHIAEVPSLVYAGSCYNGMEVMVALREKQVDLVFLDIQMPRLLGTELIKTLSHPPKVVLVTAHREFAMDGYELGVVDYLLKPVSLERFLKAVNKLAEPGPAVQAVEANNARKFLYFRADRKMVKVWLDDILYAESLKDYIKIITRQGTLVTKLSLSSLMEMLPEKEFIQVHRSFVVARHQIDAYSTDSLRIGKLNLPVGPLYRNGLKTSMQELKWP